MGTSRHLRSLHSYHLPMTPSPCATRTTWPCGRVRSATACASSGWPISIATVRGGNRLLVVSFDLSFIEGAQPWAPSFLQKRWRLVESFDPLFHHDTTVP